MAGPTASGKSSVAVELARRSKGELINADSRQIYRFLDAATSKPGSAERQLIPHHLYDFLDPKEVYSAGRFARDAERVFDEIAGRGRLPIFVGGTGLYLQALFKGLAPLPPRNEALRAQFRRIAETEGRPALHALLAQRDPEAAQKIPAGNLQRVIRALEVLELTGKPISRWHAEHAEPPKRFRPLKIGLEWAAPDLRRRIEARVRGMIPGLVEETRRLMERGYRREDPGFQSLGYREAVDCIEGKRSETELNAGLLAQTLRYAKRQRTWFRADPQIRWLKAEEPFDAGAIVGQILDLA